MHSVTEKGRPSFVHPAAFGHGFNSEDGSPIFVGVDGISHPLTEEGFRPTTGPAWGSDPQAVRVLALGCSYVFGYGLDVAQSWPEAFASIVRGAFGLSCEVRNLGVPGASPDYVARQALEGLEAAAPHILLVAFPQKERREYWLSYSRAYSVRPGADPNVNWSEKRVEIQRAREALANHANDSQHLYQAVRTVQACCRLSGTVLLHTYASVAETPAIEDWLDGSSYIGAPFPKLDFAEDGLHPGPMSNRFLALKACAAMCGLISSGEVAGRLRTLLARRALPSDAAHQYSSPL
jgi:hypothetical protein